METYNDLMAAAKLLDMAAAKLSREDGPTVISPAWLMVTHARDYVLSQARTALVGE